jgi:HD-like signal output (HDOD) protein
MPVLGSSTPAKIPPLVRLGLEDKLRDRIAQEIQTGRLRIPPLPRLALELQRLARSPVADLGEAVQLVKRDAQLTAQVLRLASSAAFRRAGGPLTSIEQAAVLIGIKGLRDVAFTASIGQVFSCGPLDERMRETQRHGFAVACGAAYGCGLLELDTDDGFLCGLLHDIGRQLILATLALLGNRHSSWLAEDVVQNPYLSLHQELGAVVIAHWGLDGLAGEVAACHHAPERAVASPQLTILVALVDAGDHLDAPDATRRGELLAEHPLAKESGLGREEVINLGELLEAVRHDTRITRITG